MILGDLNARMGNLETFDNQAHGITYTLNLDTVINSQGRVASNMCKNLNLAPVNHLRKGLLS